MPGRRAKVPCRGWSLTTRELAQGSRSILESYYPSNLKAAVGKLALGLAFRTGLNLARYPI